MSTHQAGVVVGWAAPPSDSFHIPAALQTEMYLPVYLTDCSGNIKLRDNCSVLPSDWPIRWNSNCHSIMLQSCFACVSAHVAASLRGSAAQLSCCFLSVCVPRLKSGATNDKDVVYKMRFYQ